MATREDVQNYISKELLDDMRMLGSRINYHEENIKFLEAQRNKLDEKVLDLQVYLGQCNLGSGAMTENEDHSHVQSEKETIEGILRLRNSAAGILYELKTRYENQASNLPWLKDVLGVVATLGRVEDDNFSRLLSEYLGMDTMLSLVCKTQNCVKALETYDSQGFISKSSGLHGLGTSIGRSLDGRFLVICLENLRPYLGDFIANDPQRRLNLLIPKLSNEEIPPGFLGFAVNMINIDRANLYVVTRKGYGLRETLFYHLFSRLQVYRTREDMLQALPLISNGAVSLDGGIIRSSGLFYLGNRRDTSVKFPRSSGRSVLPENYYKTECMLQETKWKKERMLEDLQREQALLDQVKLDYERKKEEHILILAGGAHQAQLRASSSRNVRG